jgi:hypothetical protein
MNIHSLIIGLLAMAALITLPVFFHYIYKKNKEKQFLRNFANLADKENLHISEKEMWKDNYLIGLDNKSNKILYINRIKHALTHHVIDLAQVENCRIGSANRNVKTVDGIKNITDRLDLIFTFRNSQVPEVKLEFYDSEVYMTIDGEHPLIEKWHRIINSGLPVIRR